MGGMSAAGMWDASQGGKTKSERVKQAKVTPI
jgi:hypothetical protein